MDTSAHAQSRVGEVIAAKYQLLRLLGAGGMGAVYEAEHEVTRRRVALKLMHPNIARSQLAAERFLREARAPGTIGHPGIVEVLDGGRTEDGSLYLVMELLAGETLSDAMRAGPLHLQEVVAIVLRLLEVLAAAHAAGFVHRDVKPDNVFLALTDDEDVVDVKLLDFGVAGVIEGAVLGGDAKLTRAGAVLGTPLYMSPEQALGRSTDERSDLWSVGALLYQALAGQPPYGGASFQELVVSISTRDHAPLGALRPDLPPRLVAVVERALRKDVSRRWGSAEEMSRALAAAVESRTTRSEADPQAAASLARSRDDQSYVTEAPAIPRWAIISGAALAIIAAGAIGLFAITGPKPSAEHAKRSLELEPEEPLPTSPINAPDRAREPALAQAPSEHAAPVGEDSTASQVEAAELPAPAPSPAPSTPSEGAERTTPKPLDAQALATALAEKRAELERCYQAQMVEALSNGQQPPGPVSLEIELAVSPTGKVERATVSGEAAAELRACVQERAGGLRFAAPGAPTSVRFPIVFQGSVISP